MSACTIDIGQDAPCALTVTLVAGSPFTSRTLARSDETPWPTPPRLTFAGGQAWDATLTEGDTLAVFTATPEDVAEVASRIDVALHDPSTGHVYARGRVTKLAGVPA